MGRLAAIAAFLLMGFGFFTLGAVMPMGQSRWPFALVFIAAGWGLLPGHRVRGTDVAARRLNPMRAVLGLHLFAFVAWTAGVGMRFLQSPPLPSPGFTNGVLCLAVGLCSLSVLELTWSGRWLRTTVLVAFFVLITTAHFVPRVLAFPDHESRPIRILLAATLVAYVLLLLTKVVLSKRSNT